MSATISLQLIADFLVYPPWCSVPVEVVIMGQRRLLEGEDGTVPAEVWDLLPELAQSRVTLQLARLIQRLWQQPALEPGIPDQEVKQNEG
jgi:hypothetical protein